MSTNTPPIVNKSIRINIKMYSSLFLLKTKLFQGLFSKRSITPNNILITLAIKKDIKDSKKEMGSMLETKRQMNEAKNIIVNSSTRGKTIILAGIAR